MHWTYYIAIYQIMQQYQPYFDRLSNIKSSPVRDMTYRHKLDTS